MAVCWNSPVEELPGIGPARARGLARLGLTTVGELLAWFPRDYEDRRTVTTIRDAREGESACIRVMAAETPRRSYVRKGLELTKVRVVDETSSMVLTFFNQSYMRDALRVGEEYVLYGSVEGGLGRRQMNNPVVEPVGKQRFTGRIMPVYPLTAGISNRLIAGGVRRGLDECLDELRDDLPEAVRQQHRLAGVAYAWETIHFPPSFEELEVARRRLVFEELFFLSAGLAQLRTRRTGAEGPKCEPVDWAEYEGTLPFALTGAQQRAIRAAGEDMTSGGVMNRLVQGDVGSGKTVVAAACAWLAAKSGWQSALMAPTELLAEQHAETLEPLLRKSGLTVGLLTGSVKGKARKALLNRLAAGEIDLLIGTHALLSEGVEFLRLGLVITDEQHRFGVGQRAALAERGGAWKPHVMVMSATPIPRTLALIIYGDLEVSVIDERPPGRQEIDTFLVGEDKRQRMYGFVRKQVEEGHQVYMVCPAVEENESRDVSGGPLPDLKVVTTYSQNLQNEVFPDLKVGLVHGKMRPKEKEAAMAAFSRGETDILVATTVIEVGVDVANATLMVVENADRFGLSQLHQLRGRVGRSGYKSYCVLVSANRNPETRQRLKALCKTNDGFQIAEEDLKIRGPGDFFGRRQHGLPPLRVADLAGDVQLLQEAQEAAKELLKADPDLSQPEHRGVRDKVRSLFENNPDIFN